MLGAKPGNTAVIVVVPVKNVSVAKPIEPCILLIVATFVIDELQVTNVVKSCVLLSEKWPIAVNC